MLNRKLTYFSAGLLLLVVVFSGQWSKGFAQSRKAIGLSSTGSKQSSVGSSMTFQRYSYGVGNLTPNSANTRNTGILKTNIGSRNRSVYTRSGRSLQIKNSRSTSVHNTVPNYQITRSISRSRSTSGKIPNSSSTNIPTNQSSGKQAPKPGSKTYQSSVDYSKMDRFPIPKKPGTSFAGSSIPLSSLNSAGIYFSTFGKKTIKADGEGSTAVTTLVPDVPTLYGNIMKKAEKAFERSDYRQAAMNYELASELSLRSPESQLGLMQSHFAAGEGSYYLASNYLQRTLKLLPELPLIDVQTKDFYSHPSNFIRDLINLENYVKNNPQNSDALLVLGYMKWQEGETQHAKEAIQGAIACAQDDQLKEAIHILWDGMVASGKVKGALEQSVPEGQQNSREPGQAPEGQGDSLQPRGEQIPAL